MRDPDDSTPPVPTVRMTDCGDGKWFLLLHIKVSAKAIAKMVAALEEAAADELLLREALKRAGEPHE
jgi:hypothetical protein